MTGTVVWTLPHMSQEFEGTPRFYNDGQGVVRVEYDCEGEGGYVQESLTFVGTIGYLYVRAGHCTADQVSPTMS